MDTKTKAPQSLNLTGAPPIPGLSIRRYRGPEDFPILAEIFNQAYAADGVLERISAEELGYRYTHQKDFDIHTDLLIAEVDGQPVAYGRATFREDAEGRIGYSCFGMVRPEWRRRGLGRFLLHQNEARLRQIAAKHPDDKHKVFMVEAGNMQPGNLVLAQSEGFQAERHFFLMLRELSEPIPAAELPAGLEVRPATREQYRAIWEALDEAFRDHWGYSPGTEEDYQRFLNYPKRDPRLWQVAWDGDQVAGMVLNRISKDENEALSIQWGWTDPIGVRRPWRRRGLARALIFLSMQLLKAEGMQQAVLGVDTQNPNSALHLYESCGYHEYEHWTVFMKEMAK